MRFLAGLIGIFGALAGLALGVKWLSDFHSELAEKVLPHVPAESEEAAHLEALKVATYLLLVCGVFGLVLSVLVMARKCNRWLNGLLLIAAGLLPLLSAGKAWFGTPMVLAGLLAFGVRYETRPR